MMLLEKSATRQFDRSANWVSHWFILCSWRWTWAENDSVVQHAQSCPDFSPSVLLLALFSWVQSRILTWIYIQTFVFPVAPWAMKNKSFFFFSFKSPTPSKSTKDSNTSLRNRVPEHGCAGCSLFKGEGRMGLDVQPLPCLPFRWSWKMGSLICTKS